MKRDDPYVEDSAQAVQRPRIRVAKSRRLFRRRHFQKRNKNRLVMREV